MLATCTVGFARHIEAELVAQLQCSHPRIPSRSTPAGLAGVRPPSTSAGQQLIVSIIVADQAGSARRSRSRAASPRI